MHQGNALLPLAITAATALPGFAAAQSFALGELTVSSPTADRRTDSGSSSSSLCDATSLDSYNDAVRYQEFPFFVITDAATLGVQVLSLESSPLDFDPVAAVYCDSFDPANPDLNLIAIDDDSAGYPNAELLLGFSIPAGRDYVLVVFDYSSFNDIDTDRFEVILSGNNVQFVCLADVNRDGVANSTDFDAWLKAFIASDPRADQNQDGQNNGLDFGAWLANFNAGCPD